MLELTHEQEMQLNYMIVAEDEKRRAVIDQMIEDGEDVYMYEDILFL